MNKSELIDLVSSEAGVEKRQTESVLNAFFTTVTSATKGGGKVAWPGFGSFSVSQRSARTGRNPQTGEAVKIPASKVMKFSASSTLKEALNARAAKKAAGKKTAAAKAPAKKAGAAKATKAPAKKAPVKKAGATTKKR